MFVYITEEKRKGQGRKGKVDCKKPCWFLFLPLLTLRSRERWGKVTNKKVTGLPYLLPF